MFRRLTAQRDAAALLVFVGLLLVISWRRWGNPMSDPGLDLTVAANWLDGIEPYRDTRYWYGPLGIAGLSGAFALLGTSFTAAYAYGLAQTALIAELWRRLARRWLPPRVALAGVAVVLAIGFSGSLFNFQLPHTEAATAGLAALLALLLALAGGARWWPGVLLGVLALTRPEFLAFGVAALGGAALGAVREEGWAAAVRLVLRAIPGALLVAVPVLGWFAARAGTGVLFTENLFPVEFIRVAGSRAEAAWHPYDLPSLGNLVLRGALAVALGVLVAAVSVRGRALPAALLRAAVVVVGGVVVATALALVGGDALGPVKDVVSDAGRLLLPMTILPAIALGTLAVAAIGWWRRAERSPLGGGWIADGALIATAAACTLRAYDAFSTDVYATYFAPPAVLVAAIVLLRAAAPEPAEPADAPVASPAAPVPAGRAQAAVALVLVAAAAALTVHAWAGRYRDFTVPVHTPRGTFVATSTAGPQVQRVVDLLAPRVRPGEPMLVLPQEAGFHFLLRTTPALYAATFLPGTLSPAAVDRAAAHELAAGREGAPPPRYVIVAARRFTELGFGESGEDFNVELHRVLRRDYRVLARFGQTTAPVDGRQPPDAYTVYERAAR
jgi:hypothetical protein